MYTRNDPSRRKHMEPACRYQKSEDSQQTVKLVIKLSILLLVIPRIQWHYALIFASWTFVFNLRVWIYNDSEDLLASKNSVQRKQVFHPVAVYSPPSLWYSSKDQRWPGPCITRCHPYYKIGKLHCNQQWFYCWKCY